MKFEQYQRNIELFLQLDTALVEIRATKVRNPRFDDILDRMLSDSNELHNLIIVEKNLIALENKIQEYFTGEGHSLSDIERESILLKKYHLTKKEYQEILERMNSRP